jgi:hypothetical protein
MSLGSRGQAYANLIGTGEKQIIYREFRSWSTTASQLGDRCLTWGLACIRFREGRAENGQGFASLAFDLIARGMLKNALFFPGNARMGGGNTCR